MQKKQKNEPLHSRQLQLQQELFAEVVLKEPNTAKDGTTRDQEEEARGVLSWGTQHGDSSGASLEYSIF